MSRITKAQTDYIQREIYAFLSDIFAGSDVEVTVDEVVPSSTGDGVFHTHFQAGVYRGQLRGAIRDAEVSWHEVGFGQPGAVSFFYLPHHLL